MKPSSLTVILVACASSGACTSEQLYASGRNAQRAECMKRPDAPEQDRCLKDAGFPYDAYKREAEAARR